MTDKLSAGTGGNGYLATPRRHLPRLTEENTFFWQSGNSGQLQFMCCNACAFVIHPPLPICPNCKSRDVAPAPVSGKATIESYTINRQVWESGLEAPYVIALVEIAEQKGVRLTTNIVNCAPEDVWIGMPVRVLFDHREDVWLPLFEPDI